MLLLSLCHLSLFKIANAKWKKITQQAAIEQKILYSPLTVDCGEEKKAFIEEESAPFLQ